MTLFSEMVADVLPFTPLCPAPVAEKALRDTAISFANKSEALVEELSVTLVPGQATYTLVTPVDTTPVRVLRALLPRRVLGATSEALLLQRGDYTQLKGRPEEYFQPQANQITFVPTPLAAEGVRVRTKLKPTRQATLIRDDVAEAFWEVLIDGAIARLALMKGTPWRDAELASVRALSFHQGTVEAARLALNDDKNKRRVVRYGGY